MKECFIITPIGESGSEIRRETDGLVTSVLNPVLEKFEFKPVPAHNISETGSINRQMIKRILETELVIANLTGLNPNVMYEVGIRHCTRKPLIVVAKEGTVLPFDLSDERTIFYRNDMIGTKELEANLSEIIPFAIKETLPDNPVYRVVDVDLIKIPEGTSDVSMLNSQRFSSIEDQLERIQSSVRSLSAAAVNRGSPKLHYIKRSEVGTPFSVYIEDQGHLDMFLALCREAAIEYELKNVYKEVELFQAFPVTVGHMKSLKALVRETGVRMALE